MIYLNAVHNRLPVPLCARFIVDLDIDIDIINVNLVDDDGVFYIADIGSLNIDRLCFERLFFGGFDCGASLGLPIVFPGGGGAPSSVVGPKSLPPLSGDLPEVAVGGGPDHALYRAGGIPGL